MSEKAEPPLINADQLRCDLGRFIAYGETIRDIAEWMGAGTPYATAIGIAGGVINVGRRLLKSPVSRAGALSYLYHANKEQILSPASPASSADAPEAEDGNVPR